jgi:hypothetical protein
VKETWKGLDLEDLATSVAPAGGSDAVGGVACAIGRAIVIIVTMPKSNNN